MKYTVAHSLLTSPAKDFKRGDIVTEKQLTDAGHDVSYLTAHEAITPVPGSEDVPDPVKGTDSVTVGYVGSTPPPAISPADKAAADKAAADKAAEKS